MITVETSTLAELVSRKVDDWTAKHDLCSDEVERIRSILTDPGIEDIDAALIEELEGVLAARRIANMNLPTAEAMQAIRTAFVEGRLPVKTLPMD